MSRPATADRLAAKLHRGRQIAEVVEIHGRSAVLVVFDDGATFRTTMDIAMSAMQQAEFRPEIGDGLEAA